MTLVDTLLTTAFQDTRLLVKNDELGDNFSVPRNVDFVLLSSDSARAETVCSFINDNRYGSAIVEPTGSESRIVVTVNMPTTQGLLCSVSALMACLAELFSVEYDGWGTVIQRET
jgi:hypothetical protein